MSETLPRAAGGKGRRPMAAAATPVVISRQLDIAEGSLPEEGGCEMEKARRIQSISISGLQEMFNYEIEFAGDGNTAILIAPNGYGKTAFLAVLNSCLQFRLIEAADYRFDELNVVFDDKTRWMFKKTPYTDKYLRSINTDRYSRSINHRMLTHRRLRWTP